MDGSCSVGKQGYWLAAATLLCACDNGLTALPVVGIGGEPAVVNPALWQWKECGRAVLEQAEGEPARPLVSIDVSPDGERAVTTTGKSVLGWKLAESFSESSIEWQVDAAAAYNARYSSDGTLVAVSGDDPQLLTAQGAFVFRPPVLANASAPCGMQTLALSADGRWLAHSGHPGVTVFELATFAQAIQVPSRDCIVAVSFSPDSQYLMTSVPELYQVGDWTRLWPAELGSHGSQYVNGVSFTPLGREVIVSTCAVGFEDGSPFYCSGRWFTIGGRLEATVNGLPSAWLDFAADGDWTVAAHTAFYQQRERFGAIGNEFVSTKFAPHGDIIAGTMAGSLARLCRN